MFKKLLFTIVFCLLLFLGYHYDSVIYGVQQGAGQVEVLWNAKEITDLIKNPNFPDSTKEKFKYISKVKAFAEKNLGLSKTKNYATFYDQKGEPILWVVTASPEFRIQAYEWEFPIAGAFPYKGFWDLNKAEKEALKMKKLGFDVEVDEVNAWSTLGWFRDPVLSSMMLNGPGRLAELIIHESTHATLYVKDSVEFNESLASFIGKIGAEYFLKEHFGETSKEYIDYQNLIVRKQLYKNYLSAEIEKLNFKYNHRDSTSSIEIQRALKLKWISKIKFGIFDLPFDRDSLEFALKMDSLVLNNAYFSGFSTYTNDLPKLKKQLDEEFNGNLKEMLSSFIEKYESL